MKPINSAPIPADRRQAGQELARLASFPELNPSPILEIDLDGCITYINPFAQKLFPDITEKGVNHPYLAAWQDFVGKMLK